MSRRTRRTIIILAGTVVAAGLMAWGIWIVSLFAPPVETKDLRDYSSVLAQWQSTGLVAHFPTSAPSTSARFVAYPGFLQGGAYVQLWEQVTPSQAQSVAAKYAPLATHQFTGGYATLHAGQPNGTWSTFYRTGPTAEDAFPESFTLYVLKATSRSGSWNHGDSHGIAVDPTKGEIVYWADQW